MCRVRGFALQAMRMLQPVHHRQLMSSVIGGRCSSFASASRVSARRRDHPLKPLSRAMPTMSGANFTSSSMMGTPRSPFAQVLAVVVDRFGPIGPAARAPARQGRGAKRWRARLVEAPRRELLRAAACSSSTISPDPGSGPAGEGDEDPCRARSPLDLATQQAGELAADGEAQAGAAVLAAGGPSACWSLEDDLLLAARDADAGVDHREGRSPARRGERLLSSRAVLHGVAGAAVRCPGR